MGRFRLRNILSGLLSNKTSDHTDFREFLAHELGIEPGESPLYEQAFRHVTLANEQSKSNERLEFVGDAVLDAIVAEYVFRKFPDHDEGFLSKMKSAVVNRNALNMLARDMQLEKWIKARVSNRQAMHVIGGNTLEALIGALYIDRGFDTTSQWVTERIIDKLDVNKLKHTLKDAKSALFEMAHRDDAQLEFVVEPVSEDNNSPFVASVIWNGKAVAKAEATSKKSAEQKAARKAITLINEH